MAHGRKYLVEFKNVQNDVFHVYISEKDYEGDILQLEGSSDQPFVTNQQTEAEAPFSPIRAKECTLKFTAINGISLRTFYSEDDERFRIDHYCYSVKGAVINQLIGSYFIVQSNCHQEFAPEPFEVTLGGTDNIALLKDTQFTTEDMPYHPTNGNYLGKITLFDYVKIALIKTGLSDLPLRIYSNIFENSIDDRSDSVTAEMFQQILFDTGKYLEDDGNWTDLYTILSEIFTALNCTLCQDNGAWNIFRRQESVLFTNNEIPGVEHNLSTGNKTAITLKSTIPIVYTEIPQFDDQSLINADQESSIQRPFRYVKNTFNYAQPSLIANVDLKLPDGAIPFQTNTIGSLRYDDYDLATYFPAWTQRNGDTSYLEVVTDISDPLQERETDRYILTPGSATIRRGVQFNPIPVTQFDQLAFTLQFKVNDDTPTYGFWVRFLLARPDGTIRALTTTGLWSAPFACVDWDTGTFLEQIGQSTTEYQSWNFSSTSLPFDKPSRIPDDGMLLIQVDGTNDTSDKNPDSMWKDITLTITNNINDSTKVIGHFHNNEQILDADQQIKNIYDEEIKIDDSPRNTIAGTLFTDALTAFCPDTNIGNVYFTKTSKWHRAEIDEDRRLGEIIVFERMHQAYKARTVLEGSLYGLRNKLEDDSWNFLSLLSLLSIDSLSDVNFMFGNLEVDWMNATYKTVLNELYAVDSNGELFDFNYIFQYIYKTT